MQEHNLTESDIKTLKYEKRMGYVFAGFILTGGVLSNIVFIATNSEREWSLLLLRDWLLLLLIDFVVIGLSFLVAFLMNRKINKDLRAGTKMVTVEKIARKKYEIDYEVGSGSLYIPGLGDRFPKLWGQEMKPYSKYVLTVNGIEYNAEKELFDTVEEGDFIEVHEAKYSEVLLGLTEHKTE